MNFVGILETADLSPAELRLNREDRPWVELLGPMLHTGGDESTLFTGRPLQAWLDQITTRSQAHIAFLPEGEAVAVKSGRVLAEMTLCMAEDNRTGAIAAQKQLKQMLPGETFRQLFP